MKTNLAASVMKLELLRKFLLAISAALVLSTNGAQATIKDDEYVLYRLFVCQRVFDDPSQLAYDRDKQDLTTIHDQLMEELRKKYSKRDVGLMLSKTLIDSQNVAIPKDPLNACREFVTLVKKRKAAAGIILSKD